MTGLAGACLPPQPWRSAHLKLLEIAGSVNDPGDAHTATFGPVEHDVVAVRKAADVQGNLGTTPSHQRLQRKKPRDLMEFVDQVVGGLNVISGNRTPDLYEVVLRKWRQDDHGDHTRPAFFLRRACAARPRALMPATASTSNGRATPSSSCRSPAPTSERS